jgi:hypothetical protein
MKLAQRPLFAPTFSNAALPLQATSDFSENSGSLSENDDLEKEGKSVLVLSWFYAQPKEIELVKRIYKKRGYSTVIVVESLVKDAATPRGWYKSFLRSVLHSAYSAPRDSQIILSGRYVKGSKTASDIAAPLNAALDRRFDVVHCMSGGFLNLYLLLSARVPLRCGTLVMDSTPILPQPRAFVRFARAYMNENGMGTVPAILPEPIHTAFYTARWSLGALYVRIKHKWAIRELKNQAPQIAERADRYRPARPPVPPSRSLSLARAVPRPRSLLFESLLLLVSRPRSLPSTVHGSIRPPIHTAAAVICDAAAATAGLAEAASYGHCRLPCRRLQCDRVSYAVWPISLCRFSMY